MSDTARTALTVVCYSVAVLAQLAAIALLVAEGRRTSAALRRWRDDEPGPSGPAAAVSRAVEPGAVAPGPSRAAVGPGTDAPRGGRAGLVDALLGNRFDRTGAVVLLAVGVVLGAIGHLLSV